jgi:hypothetical protein
MDAVSGHTGPASGSRALCPTADGKWREVSAVDGSCRDNSEGMAIAGKYRSRATEMSAGNGRSSLGQPAGECVHARQRRKIPVTSEARRSRHRMPPTSRHARMSPWHGESGERAMTSGPRRRIPGRTGDADRPCRASTALREGQGRQSGGRQARRSFGRGGCGNHGRSQSHYSRTPERFSARHGRKVAEPGACGANGRQRSNEGGAGAPVVRGRRADSAGTAGGQHGARMGPATAHDGKIETGSGGHCFQGSAKHRGAAGREDERPLGRREGRRNRATGVRLESTDSDAAGGQPREVRRPTRHRLLAEVPDPCAALVQRPSADADEWGGRGPASRRVPAQNRRVCARQIVRIWGTAFESVGGPFGHPPYTEPYSLRTDLEHLLRAVVPGCRRVIKSAPWARQAPAVHTAFACLCSPVSAICRSDGRTCSARVFFFGPWRRTARSSGEICTEASRRAEVVGEG